LVFISKQIGIIEIVPPFPGHPVVIEGEREEIPCAAQDIENVTVPHNITFYKIINRYGDAVVLEAGGNFTYKTESKYK